MARWGCYRVAGLLKASPPMESSCQQESWALIKIEYLSSKEEENLKMMHILKLDVSVIEDALSQKNLLEF